MCADADVVGLEVVGDAQPVQADAVAAGDFTQGVAAHHAMAYRFAVGGDPGTLRRAEVKIILNATGNGPGQLFLPGGVLQAFFLSRIADESRFDQDGRYIR